MKKTIRNLLLVMVCCCCIFSFASCSGGINRAEAEAHVNGFFAAVADGDYKNAETFLHPERPADLETFFLAFKYGEEIDFQKGIEIEKYTDVSIALYDSTVGGATYALTMKTTVGDKSVEIAIELVKNKNGFGIYNFDLTPDSNESGETIDS